MQSEKLNAVDQSGAVVERNSDLSEQLSITGSYTVTCYDAAGNLAYLATSGVNLRLTQERWPDITFHNTREHAVKLS